MPKGSAFALQAACAGINYRQSHATDGDWRDFEYFFSLSSTIRISLEAMISQVR
jgi:hypothetical protein